MSGDLRYLFAVGRLDDLELLKKEVAESRVVIEGLHAVAKDRIHQLNTKSPDKVSLVQPLFRSPTYPFTYPFIHGLFLLISRLRAHSLAEEYANYVIYSQSINQSTNHFALEHSRAH